MQIESESEELQRRSDGGGIGDKYLMARRHTVGPGDTAHEQVSSDFCFIQCCCIFGLSCSKSCDILLLTGQLYKEHLVYPTVIRDKAHCCVMRSEVLACILS
jgi:hypothetical protein